MSKRLHKYSIGVLLASSLLIPNFGVPSETANDPHKPRPRSKGEKARNRKFRGGA